MIKALITGIQGFAGSHLAEFLLSKGYRVSGLDVNLSNAPHIANIKNRLLLFECDIRDRDLLHEVISRTKPDEIYHLAAMPHIPTSFRDPNLTFDVNLYGTLNLFEATKEVSGNIKILYVGSATEYGDVKKEEVPINEDTPLRPTDPYSVSKVSADMLAFQYFKSFHMHIVRVRPFNHIGPRQSPEFVCSSFAKQIAEIEKGQMEPVLTVGNLETMRDFTDVRDMVQAYWLAIQKGASGEAYNICSERAISIKEVLDKLLGMSNRNIQVKQDSERLRPHDSPILLGSSAMFRKRTGWKPEIQLDETLENILDYWRNII